MWLAGVFGTNAKGRQSYAAGYPEKQDLFLSLQLQVDPADGSFTTDPATGAPLPVPGESGLLLRWEEIEYLDIQEF